MIDTIIAMLREFTAPTVFNPWRDTDPLDACDNAPALRCDRLRAHFDAEEPRFLLIGEAPGYQGCHFSGVPFTNESLLCAGAIPRIEKCERFTKRDRPWSEPSASIVWRELHKLGIAETTVMWNAFAFHPHKPGEPMSNRAPTRDELKLGLPILNRVVAHFSDIGILTVAVGNVSYETLNRIGIRCTYRVRHPSMGGANEFRAGMKALLNDGKNDER